MFDTQRLGAAVIAGMLGLAAVALLWVSDLALPIWAVVAVIVVCVAAGYLGGEWVVQALRHLIDWL